MKKLLTTSEAADYLGYKDVTLRVSRITGKLSGLPAPEHTGKAVPLPRTFVLGQHAMIEYIKG